MWRMNSYIDFSAERLTKEFGHLKDVVLGYRQGRLDSPLLSGLFL